MTGAFSKPVELVFIRDNTRKYVIWEGEIDGQHIVIHGFGALFPERYLPSRSAEASIWHCPVRTCGQAFATPPDLGDHFLKIHAGAILHDYLDGTFSVLPQDPESAYDANRQPYVASQGRMLQRPSLRQPSQSIPLQPGPGELDTPALPVDNHDMSNPQTGNKTPASSSEINSDDERNGSGDNDSGGSDTDESDEDDADESNGSDDNESDGSNADESDEEDADESDEEDADESDEEDSDEEDAAESDGSDDALPMESRIPSPKKRKADNDEVAPEPKKAKTASVSAKEDSVTLGKHELKQHRISNSRQNPAFWEQKWGKLPHSGPKLDLKQPALAYSASSVAKGCVVTDDGTSMLVHRIKGINDYTISSQKHRTINDMICTVRDAIVTVKITGEKAFTIFPEGCWHIKAGQICTVRNRYHDAEATIQTYARPVRLKED